MFVAGHAGNLIRAGDRTVAELTDDPWALAELLFPDAVSCHDTGYAAVLQGRGLGRSGLPELMVWHLLGDAYLHYGDRPAAMRRVGWAYRWLGLVAHRMADFYVRSDAAGCLQAPPRDSLRGWGHTVAEYCLDHVQVGSDRYFSPADHRAVDRAFAALAEAGDLPGRVDAALDRYQLVAEKPVPAQPTRYYRVCARLGFGRVHLGAFALKFGLDLSATALALVEEELEWFLDQVGVDEVHQVVAELDRVVGGWMANDASAFPAVARG